MHFGCIGTNHGSQISLNAELTLVAIVSIQNDENNGVQVKSTISSFSKRKTGFNFSLNQIYTDIALE